VTTDRAGNASDPSADQPIQQGTLSNDNLFGSAAADLMGGGLGDDTYHVDNVDDRVTEAPGQGFDIILANVGYTLQPDTSIDFLRAEAGIAGITLTGNASHNAIAGGDGDDVIIGAGGADSLFGQGGIDTFVLQAVDDSTVDPTGRDMIFDFSELQGDILDFSPILGAAGRGASFIGDKAFSGPRQVQAVFDGTATIVSCDIDGDAFADFAIALNGAHSLRKDNFIL